MAEALSIARETAKDENSRLRRRHIRDSRAEETAAKTTVSTEEHSSTPVLADETFQKGDDDVVPEKEIQIEEVVREDEDKNTTPNADPPPSLNLVKTEEILEQRPLPATQSWVPVVEMISPDGFTSRCVICSTVINLWTKIIVAVKVVPVCPSLEM